MVANFGLTRPRSMRLTVVDHVQPRVRLFPAKLPAFSVRSGKLLQTPFQVRKGADMLFAGQHECKQRDRLTNLFPRNAFLIWDLI